MTVVAAFVTKGLLIIASITMPEKVGPLLLVTPETVGVLSMIVATDGDVKLVTEPRELRYEQHNKLCSA